MDLLTWGALPICVIRVTNTQTVEECQECRSTLCAGIKDAKPGKTRSVHGIFYVLINLRVTAPARLPFDMLFFNAFAGPGPGLPIALVCRRPRPSESGGRCFLPFRPVPHVREKRLRGEGEVPRREEHSREELNKERFAICSHAKKQGDKITDMDYRCHNKFRRIKHLRRKTKCYLAPEFHGIYV